MWVDQKDSIYPFPTIEPDTLAKLMDALSIHDSVNLEWFELDPMLMTHERKYFGQLDVDYCSNCSEFYLLSVSNHEMYTKTNHKGESREVIKVTPLLTQLIISGDIYKAVRSTDSVETPLDVDAMLDEISPAHRFKNKLRKMFFD